MKTNEERLQDLFAYLDRQTHVQPEEIPNIDLYMDQVTTFMEEHLKNTRRYEEDKVLTKTMINNYAKNNLLPPPVKKKYSKEHMLMLIFIYYFKSLLSFRDIEELFKPITAKHFTGHGSSLSLEDIYREVFTLEESEMSSIKTDIASKFQKAMDTFHDVSEEDGDHDYLKLFSFICELSFDVYMKMPMKKEFLALSPDEFVSKILKDKIGATTIVCGPDFHFGTKASGNVKFLKDNQKKYGYNLIVVEKEQYHNKDISSTSIRKKITEGKMQDVNEMLGHPYRIIGKVEQGKHLGRTIGLPTANIIPDETKLLPPNGVYRTVVVVEGQTFNAISNVGVNPTVETGTKIKVETHIIDYENYIYNEIVQVQFYDFIRPERTFDSLEKLKQQIEADLETCRRIVGNNK